MTRPENHDAIQSAIDYLTDALLSHLAYEEQELRNRWRVSGSSPNLLRVGRCKGTA